jgi:nitrogen fixation NifU-like protein
MDIYAQNIMDHYKNPRNRGELKGADASRREINTTCGDDITVFIKLSGNKIKAIKFAGQGCAISQAAISILSEELVGKTRQAVLALKFDDIKAILGIPISERRYKCSMLGLWAIQKALGKDI